MMWKTKEQGMVKVNNMTDEHIINAIKWLVNDPSFGTLFKDGLADTVWVAFLSKVLSERRNDLTDIVWSSLGVRKDL